MNAIIRKLSSLSAVSQCKAEESSGNFEIENFIFSNFFGNKSNWRRLVLCWDEMGEERKEVISAKPAAGPSPQPLLPKTDLQDN